MALLTLTVRARTAASLVVALCVAQEGAAARQAAFQGIGLLPGHTDSVAFGVSADGLVVVGWSGTLPSPDRRAIRWSGGSMQDLGLLPGATAAEAHGVNADGSVVVGSCTLGGSSRAFRWTQASGMRELSLPTGITSAEANAVSADGSVVAGTALSAGRAFRWTAGTGMVLLPLPPTWVLSGASAISFDGNAIAGTGGSTSLQAFRWTKSGGVQGLGVLPFLTDSHGSGISGDGTVVFGYSHNLSVMWAFRWTPEGGMQALPTPAGVFGPLASAANLDGRVVGGSALQSMPFLNRACLWAPSAGAVDLNVYLPTLGVNLSGWNLAAVRGISATGRTIVGLGSHRGGPQPGPSEGWIVDLGGACYADCTADGQLTVADFGCFQTKFVQGDPYADCDGAGGLTVQDFGCFQTKFVAGCP